MIRMPARAAVLAAAFAACAVTPAGALGPVGFGPDLARSGWETLAFRGRPPAEFAADGAAGLTIRADGAVSVLYRPLPRDFGAAETADWRWRVDAGVPPTDLARRGGDDRAIAVYFLFADDARDARTPPRSLSAAVRRGRALIYVWGGSDAGRVIASPHMAGRGQMIVRQAAGGEGGGWVRETADLRGDFRRAFGREPGPLVAVAVSSDSDDTGGQVRAAVADLVLR